MLLGSSQWKKEILSSLRDLETQVSDLKKSDAELRMQNIRLLQMLKNMGKKLATRLPISIESLEKGLDYDLIFSDEVESWKTGIAHGVILDIRQIHDHFRGAIPGSYNIPFEQLSVRVESLAKDIPVLLVCENGVKSVAACELLQAKGHSFLYVLKGGMSLYHGKLVDRPASESDSSQSVDNV